MGDDEFDDLIDPFKENNKVTAPKVYKSNDDFNDIIDPFKESRKQEPGIEPVGLLESAMLPIKGLSAFYGLAAPFAKYGKGPVKAIASKILPKTGTELVKDIGIAGGLGVGGELASRAAPEEYKKPVRFGTELALGIGGPLAFRKLGRGPTSSIPEERIESARFMKEKGVMPEHQQVSLGPESTIRKGPLATQQKLANQIYNESVGLPASESFGLKQIQLANKTLTKAYDDVLTGQTVTFDRQFFDEFENILKQQQQLAESGIGFGQSRAILGALEKLGAVGKLPKKLQDQISKLSRVDETQVSPEEAQRALQIINESLPMIRNMPEIKMDARAYQDIRSILGDAASRSANPRNARILRNLQKSFDEQADRSLPPDIVNSLRITRARWEALKTLESAQLKSEPGIIPAEEIGKEIRRRVEQGYLYGYGGNLREIGEAGLTLGVKKPTTGREVFQEGIKGYTPGTSLYGIAKDVLGMPLYPIRQFLARRRISPTPSVTELIKKASKPTGAAVIGTPDKENK